MKREQKTKKPSDITTFDDHNSDGYYFIYNYEIKLISNCFILFFFNSNEE